MQRRKRRTKNGAGGVRGDATAYSYIVEKDQLMSHESRPHHFMVALPGLGDSRYDTPEELRNESRFNESRW